MEQDNRRADRKVARNQKSPRGVFITFEGTDGCGKTTQVERLRLALEKLKYPVLVTREPGGVAIAERLREMLLFEALRPETEVLLFLAARSEHARTVIRPALSRGEIVICDRFTDSTIAYQGYGLGLPVERLRELCDFAAIGLRPDVTFLLQLDPAIGMRRRFRRVMTRGQLSFDWDIPILETAINKMEVRGLDFQRRVYVGYEEELAREPDRIIPISASRSEQKIAIDIRKEAVSRIRNLMPRRSSRPRTALLREVA